MRLFTQNHGEWRTKIRTRLVLSIETAYEEYGCTGYAAIKANRGPRVENH
jgi:hypothetical protein